MRQIIPTAHHARVLRDLTAQPIEFYMKEVDVSDAVSSAQSVDFFHAAILLFSHAAILPFSHSPFQMLQQHAAKAIFHHNFPVAISIFRLIRHMQGLMPEYRAVLYVGVASV